MLVSCYMLRFIPKRRPLKELRGQHVNLNVMDLSDVYEKIMSGEDVIVRISGYCVNTKYLTPEQKTELTQRVFHEVLSMDDALS